MHCIFPATSLQKSHSAMVKGATFFRKVWVDSVDEYAISMFAVIPGFPQFRVPDSLCLS